jgi:type I restriction enzyme S subunit
MGVIPGQRITPEFLYYFFLNVDMRELGSGSSIPQINNYDVAPLKIAFPASKRTQETISSRLDEIRREVARLADVYSAKSAACDNLKASFLNHAFRGEIAA